MYRNWDGKYPFFRGLEFDGLLPQIVALVVLCLLG